MNINTLPERILRFKEVQRRTGLSSSTMYDYIKQGLFPTSITLGPRTVGWIESEVDTWVQNRINATRSTK